MPPPSASEASLSYLHVLAPGGMVSVPVSIRDFPVYALRMLATVRAALLADGVERCPGACHGLSLCLERPHPGRRATAGMPRASPQRASFCDERSFDMSWYPGIDVAGGAGRTSTTTCRRFRSRQGEVASDGPDDAIADEAGRCCPASPPPSAEQFNLSPITLDRPFFYAVLRLDRIGTILKRLEILPQAEIGALVNLAVLAQAVVIALLVLLVPLAAPGRIRAPSAGWLRAVVVFPGAGARVPVHRNLPDRESQLLAGRPHQRVCPGADRHAGVLRPWQHAERAVRAIAPAGHGAGGAGGAGLVRAALAAAGAVHPGHAGPGRSRLARGLAAGAGRAGFAGARPAVPAGAEPDRRERLPALGLGAERRVFRCCDAAREPDRAGSRVQQGSVIGGDPVCRRLGHISCDEEEFGLARYSSTITRRGVISAAAAVGGSDACRARRPARRSGRKAAYEQAMRESGRPVNLTDAQFDAIQKRKPAAMKRIEAYLKEHLGAADPAVMAAFQAVPREYYHYDYPEHRATPGDAYEETPKPWALGYGSALSDYLGQAYMTQICKPAAGRGHAGDRHRQRLPKQPAVAHRQDGLLDRDHRAAGQGGRQDLRAAWL